MLEEFQNIELLLFVSLVCGVIIALVYRFIYKGPSYSASYVNSLVFLSLITSLVIMVIGNNLARAFGLVGAMSIIRFRTAVRDVQDIVFIFFSLAVGMAAGVGLYAVAMAGTVVICLVAIFLVTFNFGSTGKAEYVLQLVYPQSETTDSIISDILHRYCRRVKLVNLKNQGDTGHVDAFYQFTMKRKYKSTDLVREFNTHREIIKFNLYFDQEEANMSF
jgi:uncharacterized membrane protein YhiD involved in acid resistance